MSSSSLRRSRRAPKQKSEYSVGDLVEITRNGTTRKARLAQCLTDGTSHFPRWLVRFEGPYKDEEVYEHVFAGNKQQDDHSDSSSNPNSGNKKRKSPSPELVAEDKKKVVAFSRESSPGRGGGSEEEEVESGLSADAAAAAKVSAREQRSRRRQALVEDVVVGPQQQQQRKNGANGKPIKAAVVKKARTEEDCVKIKLNTGTLYLYRGPNNRRAEFIRRI